MNNGTEHRPESAGRHLVSRVPVAASGDSVASVLVRLAGREYDAAEAVYVLGPAGRLDGVVPLPRLLASPGDHTVEKLMLPAPPSAGPEYDQERVAVLAAGAPLTRFLPARFASYRAASAAAISPRALSVEAGIEAAPTLAVTLSTPTPSLLGIASDSIRARIRSASSSAPSSPVSGSATANSSPP